VKLTYRPTLRGTPHEPPSSFRRDPNMEQGRRGRRGGGKRPASRLSWTSSSDSPMLRRSYRTVGSSLAGNSSGPLGSRKTVPSLRRVAEPSGSMILHGCRRYLGMESRPVGSRCAVRPSPSSANPCSQRTSIRAKTGSSRSGCTKNDVPWPCPRYGRACAGSTTVRASGERSPGQPRSREQDIGLLCDRPTVIERSIPPGRLTAGLASALAEFRCRISSELARLEAARD
jgi:hypothetical protein